MGTQDAVRIAVARSASRLVTEGLSPGRDFGDLSVRDAATGLISILPRPTARTPIPDWTSVSPDDVAVIDSRGSVISDTGALPTIEWPMHLRIYAARPETGAVIHTHGEWSSILQLLGKMYRRSPSMLWRPSASSSCDARPMPR